MVMAGLQSFSSSNNDRHTRRSENLIYNYNRPEIPPPFLRSLLCTLSLTSFVKLALNCGNWFTFVPQRTGNGAELLACQVLHKSITRKAMNYLVPDESFKIQLQIHHFYCHIIFLLLLTSAKKFRLIR